MTNSEQIEQIIPDESRGERLDQVLARLFPDYSRSRLQQWLKEGHIQVNGEQWRAKDKVIGGEQVILNVVLEQDESWQAENIPLDIVYEDDAILVINKPAGLVVHPAAGNRDGTLLNALLYHDQSLAAIPRAGIVHRLDKDTTGLLVVARSLQAQKSLVEQLQARSFLREYAAIVCGKVTAGGTIDEPIGRHPVNRKRMAINQGGKAAITHYRVAERFRAHTLLTVKLETGRTHQIRVHMAHIHFPLLGDPVYGGRLKMPKACSEEFQQCLRHFQRQALHARHLGLVHPVSNEFMQWQVEPADDMQQLIMCLREDASQHEE